MAGLILRAIKFGFGAADDKMAQDRLKSVGGHDPDAYKVHSGWLNKRAVSNKGQNWKRRMIVLRRDRLEWHRKHSLKNVPRGIIPIDAKTTCTASDMDGRP